MTIIIPSWVISLLSSIGVGVVIMLAILGLYVLVMFMGDKWWI